VSEGAQPAKTAFNAAATYPKEGLLSARVEPSREGGETSSFPRGRSSPGACLPLRRSGQAITLLSLISTDFTIPGDYYGQ